MSLIPGNVYVRFAHRFYPVVRLTSVSGFDHQLIDCQKLRIVVCTHRHRFDVGHVDAPCTFVVGTRVGDEDTDNLPASGFDGIENLHAVGSEGVVVVSSGQNNNNNNGGDSNTTYCLYAWRKYEFIPPKLFAAAKPWRLANARAPKILEESFIARMGSCWMDDNGGGGITSIVHCTGLYTLDLLHDPVKPDILVDHLTTDTLGGVGTTTAISRVSEPGWTIDSRQMTNISTDRPAAYT